VSSHRPAFAYLVLPSQEAIHGPDRAEIPAFIQEPGIDLRGRQILEAVAVEQIQDFLTL
jgi:hypothetical protein